MPAREAITPARADLDRAIDHLSLRRFHCPADEGTKEAVAAAMKGTPPPILIAVLSDEPSQPPVIHGLHVLLLFIPPEWVVNAFFYATVTSIWLALIALSWLAGFFADRAIIALAGWRGRRRGVAR